jgi:hypothetical protein
VNQRVIDAITEWWIRLRLTFVVALACLVSACGHVPTPHLGSTLKPTISAPCKTTPVDRPDFPADHITQKDDIWSQARTLLADRKVRQGYEGELESQVEACR